MNSPVFPLRDLAAEYWRVPSQLIESSTFGKGASGRVLCRLTAPCGESFVGVSWNLARADNDAFIAVARYLNENGIAVPRVIVYEEDLDDDGVHCGGRALIQDLGDRDLLSLKGEPWEKKREWYIKALQEMNRLHALPLPEGVQPPFDESLYEWEQSYFAEHFLGTHLQRKDWRDFTARPEMKALRERLAALPRIPVHRDFQSQNIMLCGHRVFFIDFQGMRAGLPEYDVASLLYDPYASLTSEERDDLLNEWYAMTPNKCDTGVFYDCACQRLMQAMGAYANLGYNGGNDWYKHQIPQSVMNLSEVLTITKLADTWEFMLE